MPDSSTSNTGWTLVVLRELLEFYESPLVPSPTKIESYESPIRDRTIVLLRWQPTSLVPASETINSESLSLGLVVAPLEMGQDERSRVLLVFPMQAVKEPASPRALAASLGADAFSVIPAGDVNALALDAALLAAKIPSPEQVGAAIGGAAVGFVAGAAKGASDRVPISWWTVGLVGATTLVLMYFLAVRKGA